MPWPILVKLLVGVALNVIGYMLMPKPKAEKPPSASDIDDPTAEAGRPIPKIFGSMTVNGVNIIAYGNESISKRKVKIDK